MPIDQVAKSAARLPGFSVAKYGPQTDRRAGQREQRQRRLQSRPQQHDVRDGALLQPVGAGGAGGREPALHHRQQPGGHLGAGRSRRPRGRLRRPSGDPLRRRHGPRRALLQPRQRADALGQHPPRRPSRGARLRRGVGEGAGGGEQDQEPRRRRRGPRSRDLGVVRPLELGQGRRRRRLPERRRPGRSRRPPLARLVHAAVLRQPAPRGPSGGRQAAGRLARHPLLSAGRQRLRPRRGSSRRRTTRRPSRRGCARSRSSTIRPGSRNPGSPTAASRWSSSSRGCAPGATPTARR